MSDNGTCTHCAAPLGGPYCAQCGQLARAERLRTPRLLREGVAEFLDMESGFLRTVRELIRAPERVVCGYWNGHTRPWVHPAKFFLVAFAVAQFVAWRTGAFDDLAAGYTAGNGQAAPSSLELIVSFMAEYFVFMVGFGLILPVVAATLVTRRTLAEQTVFAFFVFGELALVESVILPARWVLPGLPVDWAATLIVPLYLGWTIRRVFETGRVRTVLATLGFLLATLMGMSFLAGMVSGFAGAG